MAKPLPRIDGAAIVKQQQLPERLKERNQERAQTVDGYQTQLAAFGNVNVNFKKREHQIMMRDTLRHLQDIGETLNDGTEVTDKTKAMIWLLENINLS